MKRTIGISSMAAALVAMAAFVFPAGPAAAAEARDCVIRHYHGDGYSENQMWCDGEKVATFERNPCPSCNGEGYVAH